MRLHRREVKTALRRRDLVDSYFVGKLGFSPYQACAHGCLYCDGRAERYYVQGEFEHDIVVRSNIATVLAAEVQRLRERGVVFVGSGVSDAYQPPEGEAQLMRACARVLAEARLPVTLLTKSALAQRDLDLWQEVHAGAGFVLMISLQTLDDRLREAVEPHASTVEERLATLAAFKARGCGVGVAAMPLLPGLSDSDAQLDALARRLADLGVDFVLPGGLTLRPGRQKDLFFALLRRSFPNLVAHYESLYAENRPSGAPQSRYLADLWRRMAAAFERAALPGRMPHALYRDRLPLYDEVYVLLHHMLDLYAGRAGGVSRLRAAAARYGEWLLARKKEFNRRRSLRAEAFEQELRELAATGEVAALVGNDKLGGFLRTVILERRVLDYRRLELV